MKRSTNPCDRKVLEEREKEILVPYAQLSSTSLGRKYPEEECNFRPCFQRDLDRIVHSTAFRRLEYKTQVFINHEGDYYRTRLTHSLEVAQIARGLARMLRVNEDLAQTIALAHDLGHTPFGHAGEAAMCVLMKDVGGFEHNLQSFRVVTELEERYPNFLGLNLSYEVLEGILKHETVYDKPKEHRLLKKSGYPTVEAQIVNFADEIAYMNHDLDDGLQYGMLTFGVLEEVTLWRETFSEIVKKMPSAPDKVKRYRTISRLIHKLVDNLQQETKGRISKNNIHFLADIRSRGKKIVGFSPDMQKKAAELKKFLYQNMYFHWRVVRMAEKSRRVIQELFHAYLNNTKILPEEFYQRILKDKNPKRHICDYIAGMTDRFALQEHKKLFDPEERV
ncbi:MAG: deoxyguanosinetriphosphate triphosphohydrolase [Deltaproteobacteria bacterium]|nr:deoxyguanosinetriphosphate triphosphohydrolase [Deltaproteobacteria bacterium]